MLIKEVNIDKLLEDKFTNGFYHINLIIFIK